jgi:hypothetical protein
MVEIQEMDPKHRSPFVDLLHFKEPLQPNSEIRTFGARGLRATFERAAKQRTGRSRENASILQLNVDSKRLVFLAS